MLFCSEINPLAVYLPKFFRKGVVMTTKIDNGNVPLVETSAGKRLAKVLALLGLDEILKDPKSDLSKKDRKLLSGCRKKLKKEIRRGRASETA